jgi:hypothetical protein
MDTTTDYRLPVSVEVARALRRFAILERVCNGANGTPGLMGMLRRGEMSVHDAAWAYDRALALEMGPTGCGGGEGMK